jgi:hypothetical protein
MHGLKKLFAPAVGALLTCCAVIDSALLAVTVEVPAAVFHNSLWVDPACEKVTALQACKQAAEQSHPTSRMQGCTCKQS